ncbi:MAG: CBASS cGAMP-activated phospholipase [Chthoniobacterales bacterium]
MIDPDSFRILSLDGGGLKGLFAAKLLADLERDLDVQIGDYFDLITGTSTGAIIALGLAFRLPASDILQFYRDKGPTIFDASSFGIISTRYSAEPLRAALTEVFGEKTLGDAASRLVVPAFNLQRREVKLFKTRHSPRFLRDWKMKAVDVALASAAAPTYLPAFVDESLIEYIDGGIWANNPSLVGVIEAMTVLGVDRSKINLLSVGTTREVVRMDAIKRHAGRALWASQVSDVFVGADSVAAESMCEHLLRDDPDEDSTRNYRINPHVAAGEFKLDRVSEELIALGAREAEHASRKLSRKFFSTKVQPFKPLAHQYAA